MKGCLGKGRIVERRRKRSERLRKKGSIRTSAYEKDEKSQQEPGSPSFLPYTDAQDNLSCYTGRTYHIETSSGYWLRRCNFNVVNQNDYSVYRNTRHRHFALMASVMRQGDVVGTPVTRCWAQIRTGFLTFPQLNPPCSSARPASPPASALLLWLWPSTPKQWVQLMHGFMGMKINTSKGQERERFMRPYCDINLRNLR